jgi:N-acetylglucosaminyldiphosphoundecaprenol N-acetyl-beta-D-mannosaminyltransferase
MHNHQQKNTKKIDKKLLVWDLKLFSGSKDELLTQLDHHLKTSTELCVISTPNPEQYVQATQNPTFLATLAASDILLPDGWGVVTAARWLAGRRGLTSPQERIGGREVVGRLLSMATRRGQYVLIIGGREYAGCRYQTWQVEAVDGSAADSDSQSDLDQSGQTLPLWWTPGFNKAQQPTAEENKALEAVIAEYQPEIVFVALGAPYQEEWIAKNRALLAKHGVKLAMSVGGSFDYIFGKVPQVPGIFGQLRLEWLFRLITEPWRWRRQLRLVQFIGMFIKELIFVGRVNTQ